MKFFLIFVAGACIGLPSRPLAAQQSPAQLLDGVGIQQRLDEQVPGDLEFRDEAGRPVRLGDYFGRKPLVLMLVYFRCPKLCGLVLNGVLQGLREVPSLSIGEQFEVVTVSFDPRDTPELAAKKKQSYVESYGRGGAAEGWHFLTGEQPAIDRLSEAVGFHYKWDPKTEQFVHAAGITILTPEGRIARYLYGVNYAPRDLRLGLVEASQNKIGSPTDQVLLYCFHYDAATGKYTADVLAILRLLGGMTIVLVGGLLFGLWRLKARRAARAADGSE